MSRAGGKDRRPVLSPFDRRTKTAGQCPGVFVKEEAPTKGAPSQIALICLLFDTDRFDLFVRIALRLKGCWTNLNPSRVSWACLYDLALLGGLFLNDVIVGACRRHEKCHGRAS